MPECGMAQSTVVIVSGPPGSGKSTLAHALATRIGVPAIIRDEIKQGMVLSGHRDPADGYDDLNFPALEVFFAVLSALARAGVTVVAEAAFQDKLWRPNLLPLAEIADIRIIHCTAPTALIHQRITDRAAADPHRHAHNDSDLLASITAAGQSPIEAFDSVRLDVPALTVDTSDGYQPGLDAITQFATSPRAAM
ncbi:AAA family ATPase [Nocardia exalbida]|uniref:AAA family ATPase n=1 Tax=Nocardia exalbida TaxID=290231 RepID=UPI001FE1AF2D|nr:ATP-binding protein [Nocardia exalbida]